ncbi:hypothetical protein SSP531S_47470 [Streptomyces spongiicola]|uniref:Uncharacterized protein n=1 Tax=Streptomyces spongiicola TaxID=1690221 RepID=A0A388T2X1_9ACTN|nr:hypothetical protein [Streptomyces spongiicola]GBQ03277.1 hypothetical protein SSP531S_47470 [Streptomyces spongiicola]
MPSLLPSAQGLRAAGAHYCHAPIPGLGKKKLTKLTAKDIRTWFNQLCTTCQCCTRGIDTRRDQPRCCAIGQCCHKLLSPLTLTYIHSVLKPAL